MSNDQIDLFYLYIMSKEEVLLGIEDCISELEFISSVPKGHKPCYKTKTTVSAEGWFVTIRRRWNKEMGEYGIVHVNKVLSSCDLHYRMCIGNLGSSGNLEGLKELSDALTKSISGFDNLIETYKDQKKVSDDYNICKKTVIDLSKTIKKCVAPVVEPVIKPVVQPTQHNYSSEEYDDGYYSDDVWNFDGFGHTEKNPMVYSLMVSTTKEKSFFTTDNLVFTNNK